MNKICTSLRQSRKLLELGIDVNTADMYYQYFKSYSPSNGVTTGHCDIPIIGSWKEHHISIPDPAMPNADIPAWSLTALFDILPNDEVTSTTVTRGGWNIEPVKYLDMWFAEYETEKHDNDFSLSASNPIDAAFEMVVWLKERNLL